MIQIVLSQEPILPFHRGIRQIILIKIMFFFLLKKKGGKKDLNSSWKRVDLLAFSLCGTDVGITSSSIIHPQKLDCCQGSAPRTLCTWGLDGASLGWSWFLCHSLTGRKKRKLLVLTTQLELCRPLCTAGNPYQTRLHSGVTTQWWVKVGGISRATGPLLPMWISAARPLPLVFMNTLMALMMMSHQHPADLGH